MTSTLVRLALAASWRGRHRDERRAAVVAGAAAVVAVMAAGCVSAWLLSTRINERATARSFRAAGSAPPAMERSALFDETSAGQQIYVYWWRILAPGARIPGVPADPPVGSWFVSPALREVMRYDPAVAERFGSDAAVIGKDGVAHRRELLAYRFVDHDSDRAEKLSLEPGLDWIGDGAEVVELFPISVAAVALIGIPGFGLMLAALAPFGPVLERRDSLLDALGASQGTRTGLAVAHAALCAGPGAVAGSLAWYLLSRELTAVPLVGRAVFRGDLAMPAIPAVLVALGVTGLASAVVGVRPRRANGNRPAQAMPGTPPAARIVPLLVGLAVAVVGIATPDRGGAKVFLVGVVAVAIGAVAGLPYVLDRVGRRLAEHPTTLALLVGRRLQWDATSSARSLVAVGTLAVLLPLVAAWVAVARSLDTPPETASYAVELRGDVTDATVSELAERTGAVPVKVVTATNGPPEPLLVGDCRALAEVVALARCDASFEFARPSRVVLGGYERLPGARSAPPGATVRSTLFVSLEGPQTERLLRSFVVNGTQARLQVATPGRSVFRESPLVSWILGAATLAGLVGGCALLLHLAAQAARSALSRARLLAVGADRSTLRRLAGGEAGLAVAVVGLTCTAVGAVCSWLFVQKDPSAAVPYAVIAYVIVGILVAATVAGIAAATAAPSGTGVARD